MTTRRVRQSVNVSAEEIAEAMHSIKTVGVYRIEARHRYPGQKTEGRCWFVCAAEDKAEAKRILRKEIDCARSLKPGTRVRADFRRVHRIG